MKKNQNRKIAILLAAFQGEEFIQKQILSILDQKNVDITLYVNIDSSSDDTFFIVNALQKKFKGIHIFNSGKSFGSAARNFFELIKIVDFINFDYVSFSDQDDIWHPYKLDRAIRMLNYYQASGYSSSVEAFWPNGSVQYLKKSFDQTAHDFFFEAAGPGSTYVLTKDLAWAVKENLRTNINIAIKINFHDWYIYAFARYNNYKWIIDHHSFMKYRQHAKNQMGANFGFLAFFSRLSLVVNNTALIQAKIIAKIIGANNDPFVSRWKKLDFNSYLYLLINSHKCRRSFLHKMYFFLTFLLKIFLFR
ncbi:glycosyltransferase [Candidatus Methylopumilus universalis]|uniref:glycosyltransferase n=1 Tax=Candidatus Methylopumilus universalis TaxID=2588536 RepID=UPI00111DD84D|nr:glycosyltransferase [Candidatus Methylopumilus universalis]QDC70728.1 glycosyltransferase [Candidatus Methylopumilus universalis]